MRRWAVYYQSREYARAMGDPCLGYVAAASWEEARAAAAASGLGGVGGSWVVPCVGEHLVDSAGTCQGSTR